MIKALIQLIKNIFSGEPFEQTITIEFTIYDVVFALLLLVLILYKCT